MRAGIAEAQPLSIKTAEAISARRGVCIHLQSNHELEELTSAKAVLVSAKRISPAFELARLVAAAAKESEVKAHEEIG